ncbi:MAG: hypothetical protein A4S16_10870 [Proteobacteria bacterium SG_bin6]|nr:MAG: hypothetical protein A4S16_10870 [Proteobacteria bacterium SG_bin6]
MSWFSKLFRQRIDAQEPLDLDPLSVIPPAPKVIAGGRPRRLPRFRGSAVDQVRTDMRGADRTRLRLRSAFTPSRPIMDAAMFAGRAKVLTQLIRAIEDQQMHAVIFGPRGIGKTSTLHVLCGIAREARYLVRYISCGERTEFSELFRAILQDIPLLFHDAYDPTSAEIEEGLTFADVVPAGELSVAVVSDLLNRLSGTRMLIVLDEFDRAHSADFRRAIAELIKNLSDRNARVQIVIAGVANNLVEIIEHIPSIRRNIAGLQLPNMSEEEVIELITNGETASGMVFEKEAQRLISTLALGLPYLTSLIAQHAGLMALDRDATLVTRGDVLLAIDAAIEELKLRISPASRHQIDRAHADGHAEVLGTLALAAIQHGGRVPKDTVKGAVPQIGSVDVFLRELDRSYQLLAPIPDDPEGAYSFRDDGTPILLWLSFTHEKRQKSRVEPLPDAAA